MGCSMDSLVFVSSWRSPIVQAKLQVKVELQQEHINLQIMYADTHCSFPAADDGTINEADSGWVIIGK